MASEMVLNGENRDSGATRRTILIQNIGPIMYTANIFPAAAAQRNNIIVEQFRADASVQKFLVARITFGRKFNQRSCLPTLNI